jgi:dUTP pyrophosphatase
MELNYISKSNNMPYYATPESAGMDLSALIDCNKISIGPGQIETINTGVFLELPNGYAGFVFIRSSVAKRGLALANGVALIDSDYRGEIKLLIINQSNDWQTIHNSDRLAQLVITPIIRLELKKVDSLTETKRASGFGSTGR